MTTNREAQAELLPCPFCGAAEASVVGDYYVYCACCGAESGLCALPSEAIEAWNRRATKPQADDDHPEKKQCKM